MARRVARVAQAAQAARAALHHRAFPVRQIAEAYLGVIRDEDGGFRNYHGGDYRAGSAKRIPKPEK